MSLNRRLTFSVLALAAVATATGCGKPVAPSASVDAAAAMQAQSKQDFVANGEKRNFGYDTTRYQTRLAKLAHPVKLSHRGLLPEHVDNRQWCPPVYNQGQLGACTAFSMAKGLREYMQRKNGEKMTELSAMWMYYEERKHMGEQYITQDSGANMSDGMWVLENEGASPDTFCPYVPNAFSDKPRQTAYDHAAEWKTHHTTQLADLDSVKTALSEGKPVVFGFTVYLRFQFIGKDGKMSMPWKFEPAMGGHAVMAVGYDDASQSLIVRNSWGPEWGDKGYFYMPYKFAGDAKKAMEFYTAD